MKNISVFILATASFFSVAAQETTITWQEAVILALKNNPAIHAMQLETERQTSLRKTSFDLPKTDVSLLYGQYNSINHQDNNFTIMQSIPFPTVFAAQHGLAKTSINMASLNKRIAENELAFQVTLIANNWLYLKAVEEILEKHDSLLTDLLRITSLRYKTGEATLLEKMSMESQWSEIQNKKTRNQADLNITLHKLQVFCQEPSIETVQGSLEDFTLSVRNELTDVDTNPVLEQARERLIFTDWLRKVEVARSLPDIRVGYFTQTLVGTQNINGQDQYFGSSKRFHGFQLGLLLPLWWKPNQARIKGAALTTSVAQKQEESLRLNLSQRYTETLEELNKNKSSLEHYRMSVLKTANLLVYQSHVAFKNGEVDNITLLLNLAQALSIREGYLLVLQQYNQNIFTLHFLTGSH